MVTKVFSVNDCKHRLAKSCNDPKTTVANRSLDISQVVARFASGQPLDIPPAQHGVQMVSIGDYDLADRVRFRREAKADFNAALESKKAKAKEAAEKKRQEDIDKAVAERLAQKAVEGNIPPA